MQVYTVFSIVINFDNDCQETCFIIFPKKKLFVMNKKALSFSIIFLSLLIMGFGNKHKVECAG